MSVSANQLIKRQDGCKKKAPVAASTRLYQGTLVFTSATGYADDDTASGVNEFAGIAVDDYDNSSGSAGDIDAELWTDGVFELVGSGFTQADVGKKVYASDNYTITLTAIGNTCIGTVEEYVSATLLRVKIKPGSEEFPSLKLGDDAPLALGASEDVTLEFSTDDADGHGLVLGLYDTNQVLHITDKGAKDTDWGIDSIANPTIYVHSNTTPTTDYISIGGHDGTNGYINVAGGNLALQIAGTTHVTVAANAVTVGDAADAVANTLELFDGGAEKPSQLILHDHTGQAYYLWVDNTGDLRIHTSAPTDEDMDGAVVGGQS